MSTAPDKWRPSLGLVIFTVLTTVGVLPLVGLFFFRLYDNQLIRQTQAELIAQSRVLATIYAQEVSARLDSGLTLGAEVPAAALDYHRFLFALNGAVSVGWGVMIFFLAWQPFGRGERWAWWALATSAGVWFVLDTVVALSFGAYAYAIFNVAVIVAIDIPLLATAKHFLGSRRSFAAA